MIVKLLVIAGILLLSMNLYAQNSSFYIYFCFGQSNMEGQGIIETQDQAVNDRFRVFQASDCPNLGRTTGTWQTAVPPTCQCNSKLSPADYFERTVIANLQDSIKIIY